MITLVYSDTEGWPLFQTFNDVSEADEYVKEHFDPEDEWYNPCPTVILEDHQRRFYDGFRYM